MVSHEIKTARLVDLDLSAWEVHEKLGDGASGPAPAPPSLAPQLPMNLRAMKKRLSNVWWSSPRATPRPEDEDDPFGLRTLPRPSGPTPDTRDSATPTELLIRVHDSPPGSDDVFHGPMAAQAAQAAQAAGLADRGPSQTEPLTDWTRLELEAQSIAGTIRGAQGPSIHRCLDWDNFSPVSGHHSPLTWAASPPVTAGQAPIHAQSQGSIVSRSPEHSPLRPLRLPPSPSPRPENHVPRLTLVDGAPDPAPLTRSTLSLHAELADGWSPGLVAPPTPALAAKIQKPILGSAKPPLRPRNAGLARRDPGLTSSRRLSSSMGALPGTQPVTRTSSSSTGPPRRPRTQPPSLSPRTRLPTKPPLAARKAASSASVRAGPARRSLLAPSRPTPATPIQASPRRSMLATPVKATPRRSMLATPTFSRPKPTAGPTPATLAKSTPVIKSHLSVGKSQLRPRGLGAQLGTLTPRALPLTGPRPLASRAPPSKVVPVARPKRRISGLPSPLPSSGKIPS